MRSIEIFFHPGGQSEDWLHVMEDGTVHYHVANDGARLLRRGAEAEDKILTPPEAAWRWPEHAQAIRVALHELGWDVTTMRKMRPVP